jgi:hypothetical protein
MNLHDTTKMMMRRRRRGGGEGCVHRGDGAEVLEDDLLRELRRTRLVDAVLVVGK